MTTRIDRNFLQRIALGLPLLFGVVACATEGPDYFVGPSAPAPERIRRVLVVPMNFEATLSDDVARGTQALQAEVMGYLKSTGRQVARARREDVVRIWNRLAAEAGGVMAEDGKTLSEERVEEVRSRLARRLADAYPADVIAMPALVVREGRYVGMSLRWDGVVRPVPTEEDRSGTDLVAENLNGQGPGTSLRMTLYTPDGQKCFERYAGLEPVLRVAPGGVGSAESAQARMVTRTDLFQDRELLQKSVALSLSPALGPPASE